MDRRIQNKACAIGMTRPRMRVKNYKAIYIVDSDLQTGDDLRGPCYNDYGAGVDRLQLPGKKAGKPRIRNKGYSRQTHRKRLINSPELG